MLRISLLIGILLITISANWFWGKKNAPAAAPKGIENNSAVTAVENNDAVTAVENNGDVTAVENNSDVAAANSTKPNGQMVNPKPKKEQPILEAKVGYFFFSDDKMSDVYNQGGIDVQLSASYPIWQWLQVYASVEYLERHGKTLHAHQKTSIWEVPLSLGLKPVIKISSKARYYFTVGPRYFFVKAHNDSSYLPMNLSKSGLGGFVNTGFLFFPTTHLVLDIFGEYSYKKMHFHSSKKNVYGENTQVGGYTFGAGIGYAF